MATLVVLCAAGVLFYLPHLTAPTQTYGSLDWRYFQYLFEAGRTSIMEYGQFPGWSPYTCGGVPLHADPQTPYLSPFFLPVLLFGTVPGMKIYVLAHILAGLAGGWYLARTLGFRGAATLFLPVAFALGSRFAWIVQGGQFTMLTFQFLPWLLAFYIRSLNDLRFALAGAAVFALTLIEGGTYGAPMGAFFLGCYAAYRFFEGRLAFRALASLALILSVGVLLAAPKLVPMLGFWMDHQRSLPPTDDALGISDLLRMFFDRRFFPYMVDRAVHPALKYGWWGEYGAWIGPLTVALAAAAFTIRFKRNLPWLVLLLVSGAVMLGSHGPLSPWELLRHFPVFDSLRVPGRYSMLVTLALVIAASGMLDELGRKSSSVSKHGRSSSLIWAQWLLLLITAVDLVVFSNQVLNTIPNQPVPNVVRQPTFTIDAAAHHEFATYVRMNRGTLSCRNELIATSHTRLPIGKLAAMKDVAVVEKPRAAKVVLKSWSPNRMVVEVSSPGPARVVFRSNFDPNWRTDVGELKNRGGLLSLDLPGGKRAATVSYSAQKVFDGMAVLAAVLAVLAAVFWFGGRERKKGALFPKGAEGPHLRLMDPRVIAVFAGIAVLYLYPFPYFGGLNNPSENSRIMMTRAAVDHGTFVVDKA
ncbi:MAG: hypothetical protein GXP54_05875, partial [Deltaproteobacteria bacterium]|nr:hypothetical protein [Deltaproteobacteria bacterium]